MTGDDRGETTVMFVDDEPDVLRAHRDALGDVYDVVTVATGAEALEAMDETVDVVFLDRKMPGMSGREVLEELRDRGYDVPVAMVTAVEPDVDIVEMPFDDYITKPADTTTLREQVELLTNRREYVDLSRELYRLDQKKATLEEAGKDDTKEYQEIVDEIDSLQTKRDEDWLTVQDF